MDSKPSSTGGWKARLTHYHKHAKKSDYFGGRHDPDIVRSAIAILSGGDSLVFPAKTFISAVVYAEQIALRYHEDIRDVLSYPHLFQDDAWFQPYSEETCSIYEFLIPQVTGDEFKRTELWAQIVRYCTAELNYQGD